MCYSRRIILIPSLSGQGAILNSAKSNYMIFTWTYGSLCMWLNLDSNILEKVSATKLLGVWISENLDWELNMSELCIKAYFQISLLCKLKYVGMSTQDLLKTYIWFIRVLLEYVCVVWHSTLKVNQTWTLERVQKTCLRVILGREYRGYESALEVSNLETLEIHWEKLCLSFGEKCLLSSNHRSLFPRNIPLHNHNLRKQNLYLISRDYWIIIDEHIYAFTKWCIIWLQLWLLN